MSTNDTYAPGSAHDAGIDKDGDAWTLTLVRELRHPPARVWAALTDPAQLREWAPFDADRNLGTVGPAKVVTVGAPTSKTGECRVKRAEEHRLLEMTWGEQDLRWELEATGGGGTRLRLWHQINRNYISMGATGWHICFDVLARLLDERPLGRKVGPEQMKIEGWQRLHGEYAALLGVKPPSWSSDSATP